MASFGRLILAYYRMYNWNWYVITVEVLGARVRLRQSLKRIYWSFVVFIGTVIYGLTGVRTFQDSSTSSGGHSFARRVAKKPLVITTRRRRSSKSRVPVPSGGWSTRLQQRVRRKRGELEWLANVADNLYKE